MKRKVLSIILALAMVLLMLPAATITARAAAGGADESEFTAQIWFTDNQVPADAPAVRDTGEGEAPIDFFFRLRPEGTSSAGDVAYDILLWSDSIISFDLYYRIVDDTDFTPKDPADCTDNLLPSDNKSPDKNYWIYLGNSGYMYPVSGSNWYGKSVNKYFNGCGRSSFPKLKDLSEDLCYEFAISLTDYEGELDRDFWNGTINFRVNVAAGQSYNLYDLADRVTTDNWESFKEQGMSTGGWSIGRWNSDQLTDTLTLSRRFTDSGVPEFSGGAPVFTTTFDSVDIRLMLTRPGTVYYAIGKAIGAGGMPEITTTRNVLSGETGNFTYVPDTNSKEMYVTLDGPNPPTDGGSVAMPDWMKGVDGADPADAVDNPGKANQVITPANQNIRTNTTGSVITGNCQYTGFVQTSTVISGLMPDTDYFAYFVTEGASGALSHVYIYHFKTEKAPKPQIRLSDNHDGSVDIWTNLPADLDYLVFPYADAESIGLLSEKVTVSDTYAEKHPGTVDESKQMSVLDAMLTLYRSEDSDDGFTVFDVFAADNLKSQMDAFVRGSATTNPPSVTARRNITLTRADETRNEVISMSPGTDYIILAVARAQGDAVGPTETARESYAAYVPLRVGTAVVPEVANWFVPSGTAEDGVLDGAVSVVFDKVLYAYDTGDPQPLTGDLLSGMVTGLDGRITVSVAPEANPTTITFTGKWQEGDSIEIPRGKLCSANGSSALNTLNIYVSQMAGNRGMQVVLTWGSRSETFTFPYTTYTIDIDDRIENGTITTDKVNNEAVKGETVTLLVSPAEGYELDGEPVVTLKDTDETAEVSGNGNRYTFEMPASDVTVTALFKEQDSGTDGPDTGDPDDPGEEERITITVLKAATAITVTAPTGGKYEYAIDGINNGEWQSAPGFTGLKSSTEYTVKARLAAGGTDTQTLSGGTSDGTAEKDVITTAEDGSTTLKSGETIETEDGGTITNDGEKITVQDAEGKTLATITPAPAEGIAIDGDGNVEVPAGSNVTDNQGNTNTASEDGGIIDSKGNYSDNKESADSYTITVTVSPEGSGDVTALTSAAEGDTVTLTITPKTGYELESGPIVTYKDGGEEKAVKVEKVADRKNEYTFTMPAGHVTITAAFKMQEQSAVKAESVKLDKTTLSLTVGGSPVTLEATVSPTGAGPVDWSVDKDGIVKLAPDGNKVTITAVKADTVIITASVDGKMAACTVTVTENTSAPGTDNPGTDDPSTDNPNNTTPTYWIAVRSTPGGYVSGGGTYDKGVSVTVRAAPISGYRFVCWLESSVAVSTSATYTFTATANRTLTAVFEPVSSGSSGSSSSSSNTSYRVVVPVVPNGSATVSSHSVKAGDTVTIIAMPDSGYATAGVSVTNRGGGSISVRDTGDNVYTFTMPASQVTVNLTFTTASTSTPSTGVSSKLPGSPSTSMTTTSFSDVPAEYATAVAWAVGRGITAGTSNGTFSPNDACTRGQILTLIWRAKGMPEPVGANPFSDIKPDDYYYKAAMWAYEKGMVTGRTFDADAPCTRSAAVTYLWQLAWQMGNTPGSSSTATVFTDVPAFGYPSQAIPWAVSKGITNGTSATTFSPEAVCTRGQIVTFLYRFELHGY